MKIFRLKFSVKFFLFVLLLALPFFLSPPQKSYALDCFYDGSCSSPPLRCTFSNGSSYCYSSLPSSCFWGDCGLSGQPLPCYTRGGGAWYNTTCNGSSDSFCASYIPNPASWSKYTFSCKLFLRGEDSYCAPQYTVSLSCSTANKCMSSQTTGDGYGGVPTETGLRGGYCNCSVTAMYRTCCNNTTYLPNLCAFYYGSSRDAYAPPEGTCPSGTTAVLCGNSGGRPACGQAACNTLKPPCDGGPVCSNNGQTCTYTTHNGSTACNQQSCSTQLCGYNVTINVYVDYNGNSARDINGVGGYTGVTEPIYSGGGPVKITYSGGVSGTQNITGGTYVIGNIPPGNETVTVDKSTIPAGWTFTSPASGSQTVNGGPDQIVNIGIQPPAPDCGVDATGNLTANPGTVYQKSGSSKSTSSLSITCNLAAGATGTPNYSWHAAEDPRDDAPPKPVSNAGNIVTSPDTPTTGLSTNTYQSPNIGTTAYPFNAYVTVTVCNPGTTITTSPASCISKGIDVLVNPLFSISGSVYIDANKNQIRDGGESTFTTPAAPAVPVISITRSDGNPIDPNAGFSGVVNSNGTYSASGLPPGNYVVSYTNPPQPPPLGNSEYFVTYLAGNPPAFAPTVGVSCDAIKYKGASCTNGNVTNLNFGVSNQWVWLQTIGGDIFENGGINNVTMPSTVDPLCGQAGGTVAYTSISSSPINSPGIVYPGNSTPNFGKGLPNNPGWLVRNEQIQLSSDNTTSYSNLYNYLVNKRNVTPTVLCSGGQAGNSTCNIDSTLAAGIYLINLVPNENLVLTTGNPSKTITLTNNGANDGDYLFMVSGDSSSKVTISSKIIVPPGNTLMFTSQPDIHIDSTVGESSPTSSNSDLEGFYSTDGDFIIDGNGNNNCANSNPDLKLNIQGAIVANAASLSGPVSHFQINRDMCGGDTCPTLTVRVRPDYVLNAPDYYRFVPRVEKEIRP